MLRIIFTLVAMFMFIFGCTTPPAPAPVEDAATPASAPTK
jgi:hypothetical protein